MSEEEDIKDFVEKSDFLSYMEQYRMQAPILDAMHKISERTAIYLEFMAAAFLKETGLKASEAELVAYYSPRDNSFHWKFVKKVDF